MSYTRMSYQLYHGDCFEVMRQLPSGIIDAVISDPPNERMLIETLFSMLKNGCHFKQVRHRRRLYLEAHLAYMVALYYILVQWHGEVRFAIAPFSL